MKNGSLLLLLISISLFSTAGYAGWDRALTICPYQGTSTNPAFKSGTLTISYFGLVNLLNWQEYTQSVTYNDKKQVLDLRSNQISQSTLTTGSLSMGMVGVKPARLICMPADSKTGKFSMCCGAWSSLQSDYWYVASMNGAEIAGCRRGGVVAEQMAKIAGYRK